MSQAAEMHNTLKAHLLLAVWVLNIASVLSSCFPSITCARMQILVYKALSSVGCLR